MRARRFRRRRGLYLGTDLEAERPCYLGDKWCGRGILALGATGDGKTRDVLSMAQQFSLDPESAVVLMTSKGGLGRMLLEWGIAHGLTSRIIWFDPAATEHVLGYSPLRPNGLPEATHAKAVREGIRAAWGQEDFEHTAQLARFLYLGLYATRLCGFTLLEALQLLYPRSSTRQVILERIEDPFLKDALGYFASLRDTRQEELAASTVARLEAFLLDPTIRRILIQQENALDVGEVIRARKIVILNLERNRPLRIDDVKLLGKLFINDIVAQVFARGEARPPVRLIIDEAHDFCTSDLMTALNQGRELGLTSVLAHQYLGQLVGPDGDTRLLHAVRTNCRTKLLFGGTSPDDLRMLEEELFLDQVDPLAVKDEIRGLELDPIEDTRESVTHTKNWGETESESWSESESESETEGESEETSESIGTTKTTGRGWTVGVGWSEGESESETNTKAMAISHDRGTSQTKALSHQVAYPDLRTETHAITRSRGETSSSSKAVGEGHSQLFLPSDDVGFLPASPAGETSSANEIVASGTGAIVASGEISGDARTTGIVESHGETRAVTQSRRTGTTATTSRGVTRGTSTQRSGHEDLSESESTGDTVADGSSYTSSFTRGTTKTRGRSGERAKQNGGAVSVQTSPWHSYRKSRPVTHREFWSKDEQLDELLRRVMTLPTGHRLVKVHGYPAAFIRAPYVPTPRVSERLRGRSMARIYSLPLYQAPAEIEVEERSRRAHLLEHSPRAGTMESSSNESNPFTITGRETDPEEKPTR